MLPKMQDLDGRKLRKSDTISRRSIYRQILTTIPAALCTFLMGCTVGWSAPATAKLFKETSMTADEASWLGVVNEMGHIISPVPGGILSDKYGRKFMLASSAIFTTISWTAITFVRQRDFIYLFRFLLGLATGFGFCCVYAYVGEISSPEIRGSLCILPFIFFNIGILFQYIVGEYFSFASIAILTLLISLVYTISLLFIPESPYYLLSISKHKEAIKVFTWLKDIKEDLPLSEINAVENSPKYTSIKNQIKILFSTKSNLKSVGVCIAICILTEFTGRSPILIYATNIFETTEGDETMTPGQYTILLGVIQVLVTFVPFILSDRIGRVPLLLISSISAGICHILTVVSFYIRNNSWFRFFTVTGYIFCTGIGMAPIASTMSGDYLGPDIRGLGSGIVSLSFGMSNILAVRLFYEIWHKFNLQISFAVVAFSSFIVTIFVYFCLSETKGKTFREIQDNLK